MMLKRHYMESNTLFYLLINVLEVTPDIDYDNQVLYIPVHVMKITIITIFLSS